MIYDRFPLHTDALGYVPAALLAFVCVCNEADRRLRPGHLEFALEGPVLALPTELTCRQLVRAHRDQADGRQGIRNRGHD